MNIELHPLIRLSFATKQLEQNGIVLGSFIPTSKTEGAVELARRHTYLIRPEPYGCTLTLYRIGQEVAVRKYDFHDGIRSLSVGDSIRFDLSDEILYCPKGRAGKVSFTEQELCLEFNSLVPGDILGLVAALVALDTMWANLVGFTRTRSQPGPLKEERNNGR